jgi:acyl carrier protein
LNRGAPSFIIVREVKVMANEKMDEIRKGFAERLKLSKVDDNQSLKDLGLDSLDVVEMCLDLEDKYQIQFTTEELSSFKTVGDLLSSIEKKLGEKK